MSSDEHEKKRDEHEEEAPLELAPVEDEPPPPVPTSILEEDRAELEREAKKKAPRQPEEEELEPRLPTLSPLDVGGILAWPVSGESALTLMGGFLLVLLIFVGAWFCERFFAFFGFLELEIVGVVLRVLFASIWSVWFLAYLYRALHAAYEGRATPPPWLEFDPAEGVYSEGIRVFCLIAFYGAPALIGGLITGSLAVTLLLALAAWALLPAALLLLVAGERLTRATPVQAYRIAIAGEWRYLYCLVPVAPFLILRLCWGPAFFGAILEWLIFVMFVLSAFMTGLLAREDETVERQALATGWVGEVVEAELGGGGEEE